MLVANRGEIALRVIAGCRALGLRSVAVYTDADAGAPHVREADDAVRGAVLPRRRRRARGRRAAGADAVHPGYGFLSERAAFAQAVRRRRARLRRPVRARDGADGPQGRGPRDRRGRRRPRGPRRRVVRPSGGPDRGQRATTRRTRCWSRRRPAAAARACGSCATRPTSTRRSPRPGARRSRRSATTPCWSSGTSSTAGTSRCRCSPTSTATSCTSSSATARSSAGTRRCSRRRRPRRSPPEIRATVTDAAVALARQVGYVNAGTVEFLVDADTGEAYFLEMNTRLQVEHPVTELVVGRGPAARPGAAPAAGRGRRAAAVHPGRRHPARARDRGPGLRRGRLPRLPAAGRHRPAGALAGCARGPLLALGVRRPRRRRAGERAGRLHGVRPDARQGDRARPRPGGRPAGAGRGARRHRDPRPHHQRRASCGCWWRARSSATPRSTPPGSTTPRSRSRRPTPRGSSRRGPRRWSPP